MRLKKIILNDVDVKCGLYVVDRYIKETSQYKRDVRLNKGCLWDEDGIALTHIYETDTSFVLYNGEE